MKAFFAFTGTGPAITYMAGAAKAASKVLEGMGASGASGGAACAVSTSYQLPPEKLDKAIVDAIASGALLRPRPDLSGFGWLNFRALEQIIDELLGAGRKMGDSPLPLVIGVTPLDGGGPMYLSKKDTPQVLVREAVSAACRFKIGISGCTKIPSLGTAMSPDVRLFVDSGRTDNTCDGVWRDRPEPTVAFRLATPPGPERRVFEGELIEQLIAEEMVSLWAANQTKTGPGDFVIDVGGANDWRFSKSAAQCRREIQQGYDSALEALTRAGIAARMPHEVG